MIRIALIGDIHRAWNQKDVDYFNNSDYDLLLFTGDIPDSSHNFVMTIVGRIARIQKEALFMPGNHDGVDLVQFVAELNQSSHLAERYGLQQEKRCQHLARALDPVKMVGYSRHSMTIQGASFDIIAARPHSMGGEHFNYHAYLKRRFQVGSLQESVERLKSLIDDSNAPLIFFSHNGPSGLGDRRHNIWGCDFKKEEGDYGDPDLQAAIEYAIRSEKKVIAVLAGHMHHELQGGGERTWCEIYNNMVHVNAARVPRIFKLSGRIYHHHVGVTITDEKIIVNEVLVHNGKETSGKTVEKSHSELNLFPDRIAK